MYYFNSWNSEYKQPFGAIKAGQVMKINFSSTKENIAVKFIIRRDFGQRHEFEMQEIETGLYSSSVQFDVGHGLYFYYFEITEPTDWGDVKQYYGRSENNGEGVLYISEQDVKPYQVTVYDFDDKAPDWYRDAVFYQIFPDRFNNGNPDGKINAPKANSFLYGSLKDDPFYVKEENGAIARWDFFGGNLKGITAKIPYLKTLGVSAIYLNPIFSATSNHRYDTNDYLEIDEMLGDEVDFKELLDELHANQMHLVLDGVFSHVGKNSRYFNISKQYGENEGATQSIQSPYFDWFKFTDYPQDYKSWWGIKDLPEVDKDNESFRQFIYGKTNSVLQKWNDFGLDGWRLDVADELPDSFIRGIRENLNQYQDTVLIGEVWEDASNKISYGKRRDYILGDSLHGCMNYPFRDMIIRYLTGGMSAYDIAHQLMILSENYPTDIFYNNLNNLGTHDTERILTMIGQENNANAVGLMFSLPGVPCIYYGDEAGLTGGKDPSNRKYFPWDNIPEDTYQLYQKWTKLRNQENLLRAGSFTSFYADNCLGILRYDAGGAFVSMFNPSNEQVNFHFEDLHFSQKEVLSEEIKAMLQEIKIEAKSNVSFKVEK
ncbi:glycoside hydrolase family 13 protein [Lactococcus sp.]|uniref:glycoside hydrolase family 13 protein n=1 Tax=Lactococcus sp. TaxID=44273 RepID=UPI0035ADAF29